MTPATWSSNRKYASWIVPLGATATRSPGHFTSTGSDLVTCVIPSGISASVKNVRTLLNYQLIPPYYLKDRLTVGKGQPARERLRTLTQPVDYNNTAAKGGKISVASAATAVR